MAEALLALPFWGLQGKSSMEIICRLQLPASFEFTGFIHDGVAWGCVENSTTKYPHLRFWSQPSGAAAKESIFRLASALASRLERMRVDEALLYFDEPSWATWAGGMPAPIARLIIDKTLAGAQAVVPLAQLSGTPKL